MKKLVHMSKEVGAHGIKFQILFELNSLTTSSHGNYSALSSLVIEPNKWKEIFDISIENGLDIIAMPLDCSVFDNVIRV